VDEFRLKMMQNRIFQLVAVLGWSTHEQQCCAARPVILLSALLIMKKGLDQSDFPIHQQTLIFGIFVLFAEVLSP